MTGREIHEYHVFLASPGDVPSERARVRAYFEELNRTAASSRGVRFQVVDWENFASAGVGRPQELITEQTLERFADSLVLVVVIMAQRFGSPSGLRESGTEEEVRWALAAHSRSGSPEVKFFFRDVTSFVAPPDLDEIADALAQWKAVRKFRDELDRSHVALVRPYPGADGFEPVLRNDLDVWFHAPERPWQQRREPAPAAGPAAVTPPEGYLRTLVREFEWLDIAGIDTDRAFRIPLDKVYVRLRVIVADEGGPDGDEPETGSFGLQTALERYPRLVIVGDPGSGKSTFLRFIALTLAWGLLTGDAGPAAEKLSVDEPLPVPVLVSCWDLSEYLQRQDRVSADTVVDFVAERVAESGWPVERPDLDRALAAGRCIVLIDGLDEVPTDDGRRLVRGLIEDLVARHQDNRYVVTSRIRAYTGAAVVGQDFVRCDIQPFDREDRTEFLRSWVGELAGVRGHGEAADREAADELAALSAAIETGSIRTLAVNPLLLTVIAIVHWNRKRLPEQRVDLYDECIDVLLGQRKEAEQQRSSRDPRILDPAFSDERHDHRAFVRKRFAEIAYAILRRADEEIGRAAVLDLLEPHFATTADPDSARTAAERFVERQELRSGLLVRRRSSTYRFVHLTFLEYLAAWHLATRDLDTALQEIADHIREPTWFETLQLLGGALANRSDEQLDRYVGWLLDRTGDTLRDQAPVIALSANIVRDTSATARLAPTTQARYEAALTATFDAFSPTSRVPKQTQLDLLAALGDLGPAVKDHLLLATKSRLQDVRRQALEMLVPHLSDDDLFGMEHVLADRSQQPVKIYITALVYRDRERAGRLLLRQELYGDKTSEALAKSPSPLLPAGGLQRWPGVVAGLTKRRPMFGIDVLEQWEDRREVTYRLVGRVAEVGGHTATTRLAQHWGDRAETWELIERLADTGSDAALGALRWWSDRERAERAVTSLAGTGSATAMTVLRKWGADLSRVCEQLDAAARQGADTVLPALIAAGDARAWDLVRSRAEAGSGIAMRLLTDGTLQDWRTVVLMAEAGNDAALWAITRDLLPQPDQIWSLVRRRAKDGSALALLALLLSGRPPAGLASLDNLDDEAVRRIAEAWNALDERNRRFTASNCSPAFLIRLAAAGTEEALRVLGDLRLPTRRVAPTLEYWAERGSEAATSTLVNIVGFRSGFQNLIVRRARAGSGAAVHALVDAWGDKPFTWGVMHEAAAKGSTEAELLLAWLEWAGSTGGVTGTSDLFAVPGTSALYTYIR